MTWRLLLLGLLQLLVRQPGSQLLPNPALPPLPSRHVVSDPVPLNAPLGMLVTTETSMHMLCMCPAVSAGNAALLVESSSYLTLHWQQEAQWDSPAYYWPSHDNAALPAAIVLLSQLQRQQVDPQVAAAVAAMQTHHQALSHMFRGWMRGQVRLQACHTCCRAASRLAGSVMGGSLATRRVA